MSDSPTNQYDLSTISSGVSYIKDGYIEYAQEVISSRALASLYDGLKPVNRRILYTFKTQVKSHMTSMRACGNVNAYHPHGDSSVYDAMVLMTQHNGSLAFPLIDGKGNFGGVYKDNPPAAARYTEAMLHANASEYFNELDGINMIPNYDSTLTEPELLPVSFPAVLVNSTSGIAVGFRSNVPSFNFNDVCDLVIENITDGACHTVICPDFVTGGYYVKNDKELMKLMQVGKGSIKLRGKTITDGKKIIVTEFPFGKTIQKLMKQINDLNVAPIRNAYNTDDFDGSDFTIDCTSKAKVDEALYYVIKKTDFQYNYSADITVVDNGKPVTLGVWEVIDRWVKWRREVLITAYKKRIDILKESLRESIAFMNVVNSYDKKMELVRIIADSGRANGVKYITENFTREEVPSDLIDWVGSRPLPSYHTGGKYREIYENGQARIEALSHDIENIDEVIVAQQKALKAKYGEVMKRRTEVTTKDYNFVEDDTTVERVIDNSPCVFEIKDGFVRKLRYVSGDRVDFQIEGNANDTLIAFDNRGRLLRLFGQDLSYSSSDIGMYMPSYFNLDETDDYKITWVGKLDGGLLMLLYKDGNVGFVDTSEWTGNNRNVKVLQKGIAVSVADKLGAVLTEIPEMLFVTDEAGRIAWCYTKDIKIKDRKAKTRVFTLSHDTPLDSYAGMSVTDGTLLLGNIGEYYIKLKALANANDYRGDEDTFTMMM